MTMAANRKLLNMPWPAIWPVRRCCSMWRAPVRVWLRSASLGMCCLSDDNGESWRQAASVPTRNTLVGVTFVDNQTGYAVGHAATILKTEDGGDNWTLQYNERNGETRFCGIFCRCPKRHCGGWFFLHI